MTEKEPLIELAGTVTIGPKGQVVIPAEVRTKMDIKPGDKLVALYVPGKASVCFVAEARLQYLIDKMGAHVDAVRTLLNKETSV